MKIPATRRLAEYLSGLRITSTDLIRRGVPRDALYRILRQDVGFISDSNAARLAEALGLSEDDLLRIAVQGVPRSDGDELRDTTGYHALPRELLALADAWPELSPPGRECIVRHAEYIIFQERESRREKNTEPDSRSA